MRRHFLTEPLNLNGPFFCYFKRMNCTPNRLLIFAFFLLSCLSVTAQSYNNIEFIQNKGQWDDRVRFKGDISNGNIFIRDNGFTVLQHNPVDHANFSIYMHGFNPDGTPVKAEDKLIVHSHAWNVDFVGASRTSQMIPEKMSQGYNNYFVGNDPSKWAGDCRMYQALTMKDVYPNVDVRYYTDNGFLKYDIIAKPGADISKIALKYSGVDALQVKNKDLLITTSIGVLKESLPYSYQADVAGRKEINCKYSVKDNTVRFDVKNYDPTTTLVIDPVVIFGSFTGSTADNWGFTATFGPDGTMYGGGIVFDSGFPVSSGAFQTTYSGGFGGPGAGIDIGIMKLSSNGSSRIYATYIGGGDDEQPHSLIVDAQGNLILAGRTRSSNYPVTGSTIGSGGDWDIVVTKLNAAGNALIGSRKIGGSGKDGLNITLPRDFQSLQRNYGDDGRSEVILDGSGNIYVASSSQSRPNASGVGGFPVTPGVFQPAFGGGLQDAVLIKMPPDLSALSFASYFGGTANDAGYVLSLAPNGNIYMAGGTESGDLPGPTIGTVGASTHGTIDGYVTIINNSGTAIVRTTYIGTSGADQVFGIQFDSKGFPYVMGQTTGTWVPFNATYSNAGGKQFIAKLQPDLSAFVYSTMFGSGAATPNISPIAMLVDRCENVYISGWGGHFFSSNPFLSAGTGGLPVTADAIKSVTDGKDMYFFVLKKDAASLLFGSFYGESNQSGPGTDHVDGGTSRFDAQGNIYQAICGNCKLNAPPPSPIGSLVTSGAWATNNPSPDCNLTMVKIAMNLAGVKSSVTSSIDGEPRDTAGCVPLTVDFSDSIANGQTFEWYFNYVPGNPPDLITTTPTAQFTYNSIGVYPVMLVAVDPNTCNVRDSSFMNIKVGDVKANLAPAWQPFGPGCPKFTYEFINNSTNTNALPFLATTFEWDFGDGSPRVPAPVGAANAVYHTYPALGTYKPKLILHDPRFCNDPDDSTFTISIADNVKAIISTPATGCKPYLAQINSASLNAVQWQWNFGDPTSPDNTSTLENPSHLYVNTGTYTITLTAINPGTCNISHDTTFTIQVFDAPVPDFDWNPKPPLPENTPTIFTNLSSSDAVRFKWDFGDGDSILTTSRAPVSHQYNTSGTFNACLTAYNAANCDSTICKPVQAFIISLVDVPNAFTPNSGDINSVVKVMGFGIGKMTFTIWNRWGQKVFETNNRFQGWDGKVGGVVQPMDVYAYTLNIEFTDGTKATKKGDITLIR